MADRSTWWDEVDAELSAAGAAGSDAPDPWRDDVPEAPALTADQQAFLEGLADQPAVPRLTGWGADPADAPPEPGDRRDPTGSPPGDTQAADS
jgi:hypothetical protein